MDISLYQLILNAFIPPLHECQGIPERSFYEEIASARLDQPPVPRRSRRRWLLIGGLAFAFMLALGIDVFVGSSTNTTQAAALTA